MLSQDKRVLLLSGYYYPESVGGTEKHIQLLGSDLESIGWDVSIAAASSDETTNRYQWRGTDVYRYPISSEPSKLEFREESEPKYISQFKELVDEIKPSVAHIQSLTRGCGYYHARCLHDNNIPLVLTIHVPVTCSRGSMMRWGKVPCDGKMLSNRCTVCTLHKHGVPNFIGWLLCHMPDSIISRTKNMDNKIGTALSMKSSNLSRIARLKELFEITCRIVTVSKWLRDVLILNGVPSNKIVVMKNGLDTEDIANFRSVKRKDDNKVRIGYIGRFTEVKGLHVLVKAILLTDTDIGCELHVYGRINSTDDKKYYNQVQELAGGDNRIYFYDEMTDGQQYEVYRSFDILAMPSLCLENMPYVILEAFAAKLPVMGSDLGGISENVRHDVDGVLIKAGNVEQWAVEIANICRNKERLDRFRTNIKPVTKSIEVAREMNDLYLDLINS